MWRSAVINNIFSLYYLIFRSNNFDSKDEEKLDFIKKNKNFNDTQVQKFLEVLTRDVWNQKVVFFKELL